MDLSNSGLKHYVPLPGAVPFHESTARTRLVYGSNLAGKTLACAVEFARRALADSTRPKQFAMAGRDYDHVMGVMWPMLTSAGAFLLPDGQDAPPLIPKSAIPHTEHDTCAGRLLRASLSNGNEIFLCSSRRRPKTGSPWGAAWVDEHLQNRAWIDELLRGCIPKNGLFLWSTLPAGDSWKDAWLMAQRSGDGYTEAFHMTIEGNSRIPEEYKQRFRRLLNPNEVRSRWLGLF